MTAWYYVKGGEWFGPVAGDDLKRLAAVGLVQPTDLVWREGTKGWVAASKVTKLFADQAKGIPTAPPTILPLPNAPDEFAEPTFSEKSGRNKTKPRQRRWLVWAGAGGVMFVGLVMLVVYLARSDDRITEDYFPRTPGAERPFVYREYRPDGSALTTRRAFAWKDEGTLEWWDTDNPKQRSVNAYRTNKGFVELRVVKQQQGEGEWEPFLKVGAKPGDTWDRRYKEMGYAESISFRYEEFKTYQQRPCVVISYEMKGGTTTVQGRRWYLKGIGLVRDEAKRQWEGSWRPYTEIVYAEWGSDATPKQNESTTSKKNDASGEPTPVGVVATELTRLQYKAFVIFYKGFSEEQMKDYIDNIDKYYGIGKEPRRSYGIFSYQAELAKTNLGMRIVREDDFTRIMIPVGMAFRKPQDPSAKSNFAALAIPVCHGLIKIDESVRGKLDYATCNDDCTMIYLAGQKFFKR